MVLEVSKEDGVNIFASSDDDASKVKSPRVIWCEYGMFKGAFPLEICYVASYAVV